MVTLKASYRIKSGTRPNGSDGPGGTYDGTYVQDFEYVKGLGDLDQCNGRFAATPENPAGEYHYVITTKFPYISRCFTGRPDSSFERRRPNMMDGGRNEGGGRPPQRQQGSNRGQRDQQGGGGRGGPPNLSTVAKKLGVSVEKLRRALGPPPPNFERASRELGISVDDLRRLLPPPR